MSMHFVRYATAVLLLAAGAPGSAQAQAAVPESAPAAGTERRCQAATYPEKALEARAEGTTWLKVTVGVDGKVMAMAVEKAAGPSREHRLLDRAAAEHVARCLKDLSPADQPRTFLIHHVWKHGLPDLPASAPERSGVAPKGST